MLGAGEFMHVPFFVFNASHHLTKQSTPTLVTGADVLADPKGTIGTQLSLAARSAAWFWEHHPNATSVDLSALADGLSNDPKQVTRSQFDSISRVIATDEESYGSRLTSYADFMGKYAQARNQGNPYEAIQAVMGSLDVRVESSQGYQSKFGILVKPNISAISNSSTSNSLDAELNLFSKATEHDLALFSCLVNVNGKIESVLSENPGVSIMFPINIPQSVSATETIGASDRIINVDDKVRAIGICQPVDNGSKESGSSARISPDINAVSYLREYERYAGLESIDSSATKVEIIKYPAHGSIVPDERANLDFNYFPDANYEGGDTAIFRVIFGNGIQVDVHEFFHVYESVAAPWYVFCNETGGDWKISNNANASMTVSFADLPGASVGQEQSGSQGTTTITLDTDAAGYGWFVDSTLDDNAEFLPTANPNEWVAKAGTDAYGKMDMYTVLLHEMGHALGLDHSADAHDFMAPTLEPGVRHLLSDADLAAVAKIAGVSLPEREPGQPLPSLPFDLSLMAMALRRREAGSNLAGQDGDNDQGQGDADALDTSLHYDVVVHPALTNSDFNGADGWSTEGQVSMASGEAVLSEAANSQTRMNQVFTVGPNDKFLRFTVGGVALDNPGNLPEDAFEVALLDANTGDSLLDPINLSHADAFLNLQGDGSTYLSDAVSVTANADGSRTYVVDLSTIPVGTAVNLSFDLLGFGAVQSQVTVRDLHIGVPQTHDDSAQTE